MRRGGQPADWDRLRRRNGPLRRPARRTCAAARWTEPRSLRGGAPTRGPAARLRECGAAGRARLRAGSVYRTRRYPAGWIGSTSSGSPMLSMQPPGPDRATCRITVGGSRSGHDFRLELVILAPKFDSGLVETFLAATIISRTFVLVPEDPALFHQGRNPVRELDLPAHARNQILQACEDLGLKDISSDHAQCRGGRFRGRFFHDSLQQHRIVALAPSADDSISVR